MQRGEEKTKFEELREHTNVIKVLSSLFSGRQNPTYVADKLTALSQHFLAKSNMTGIYDVDSRTKPQQALLNYASKLSYIINMDILSSDNPLDRMSFYLEVSRQCLKRNDHQSAHICYQAITQLGRLTKKFKKQDSAFLLKMGNLFNHKTYTGVITEARGKNTLVLPTIPLLLTPLTFANDKGQKAVVDELVQTYDQIIDSYNGQIIQDAPLGLTNSVNNAVNHVAAVVSHRQDGPATDTAIYNKQKELASKVDDYEVMNPKKKGKKGGLINGSFKGVGLNVAKASKAASAPAAFGRETPKRQPPSRRPKSALGGFLKRGSTRLSKRGSSRRDSVKQDRRKSGEWDKVPSAPSSKTPKRILLDVLQASDKIVSAPFQLAMVAVNEGDNIALKQLFDKHESIRSVIYGNSDSRSVFIGMLKDMKASKRSAAAPSSSAPPASSSTAGMMKAKSGGSAAAASAALRSATKDRSEKEEAAASQSPPSAKEPGKGGPAIPPALPPKPGSGGDDS